MIYQEGQVFAWPGGSVHVLGVNDAATMACCELVMDGVSTPSHKHVSLPLALPQGAELVAHPSDVSRVSG